MGTRLCPRAFRGVAVVRRRGHAHAHSSLRAPSRRWPGISALAGEASGALLRQLGPAPRETQGRNVADILAPAYERLAQAAEGRALGE